MAASVQCTTRSSTENPVLPTTTRMAIQNSTTNSTINIVLSKSVYSPVKTQSRDDKIYLGKFISQLSKRTLKNKSK